MNVFHLTWTAFSDWNLQRAQKHTCVLAQKVWWMKTQPMVPERCTVKVFLQWPKPPKERKHLPGCWHRRCGGWTWTHIQWFRRGALWKAFYSDQNLQRAQLPRCWHRRFSGWRHIQWFHRGALWSFQWPKPPKSTTTYLGVGTEGFVVEHRSNGFIGVLCWKVFSD